MNMRSAQVIKLNDFTYHRNSIESYARKYPLHHAARSGNLHDVKEIVKTKKLDIDGLDQDKNTPVIMAAKKGKIEVVMYLLNLGCNIDHVNTFGDDALLVSAINNHIEVVKILINSGVNVNKIYNGKKTILHIMSEIADHDTFSDIILKFENYDQIDDAGNTALLIACRMGHVKQVIRLLFHGANANYQNPRTKMTPLLAATESRQNNIAKYLLEYGAKWDVENQWGENALHRACNLKNLSLANLLYKHGGFFNVEWKNRYGQGSRKGKKNV